MIPGLGGMNGMNGMPGFPGLGGMGTFPGLGGLGGIRPLGGGLAPAAPNLQATLAALQAGGGLPGMNNLGAMMAKANMPILGAPLGLPGLRPGMPLLRPPLIAAGGVPGGATSKAGGPAGPALGAVGMLAKAAAPNPLTPGLIMAGAAAAAGPAPCTVYVGRISSEVSDEFVKQLLEKCGTVTKWNRAADPNTSKLTSFGFCDFEKPEGVWRALECLHEKQLCDKRLLVKCEEKAKQTIDVWKDSRRSEFEKGATAKAVTAEEEEALKDPAKAGREAWAKAISAAKTAKDGDKEEEKADDTEKKGPLTDVELQDRLLEESKDVSSAIAKLLQDKNKGYPELDENQKDDAKDKDKDKDVVMKPAADAEKKDVDKENDKEQENDKDKADDKGKGKDDTEDRGKKRTRSEEKKHEEKMAKEKEAKAAVSRHYRQPRRERDREQRVRDRDRDIEKEYTYRIREFERNEEHRIKNLKRDLGRMELTEASEREIRKMSERDLNFDEREERGWKRQRIERERDSAKEKEKDNADRAQVQKERAEEAEKKEQKAEEERLSKEKEEEEQRLKQEEEERLHKKEIEEAQRKKQQAEDDEKRRVEDEERAVKEKEQKVKQQAAAAKLMLAVQEEMRNTSGADDKKGPIVTGTVEGPKGSDQGGRDRERDRDDEPRRDSKPQAEAPKMAPPTAATPAVEAKLRDDEMRRLIGQVPTDKAKAFAFDIDWDVVHQNGIIEKKLRPWVRKKVTEFLGAEEQGMIEFIMRKVSSHTAPASILAELEGFIDEEAENFTLKMWRMLIFEVLRVKAR